MAALFTAVVRAPVTGIILAIELTGTFTLLLPMLGACFAAMLVTTFLHSPPIYDSLRWDSESTGGDSAKQALPRLAGQI
jgi:CIC family chloride channel protein